MTINKSARSWSARKLSQIFLISICLITQANVQAAPEKAQPAKFKAWLIKEETSSNGKYEFLISAQALSLNCRAFGFRVLSKAPDWKVTVLRDKEKEIATCTLAQWKLLRVPSFTMAGITQDLQKPDSTAAVKGSSPQRLHMTYKVKEKKFLAWQSHETGAKTENKVRQQENSPIKLVEVESFLLPCPAQAGMITTKLLNLPPVEGIPGAVFCTYENGERGWQIKTVSASQVDARESDFNTPSAPYKNMGTVNQAFLGKSAMQTMEGLTDLIDIK